jgi:hypothetical protein
MPQLQHRRWAFDADARCRCVDCGRVWVLELDVGQVRRLFSPDLQSRAPDSPPEGAAFRVVRRWLRLGRDASRHRGGG